ncbi:MAG: hypothetical protein ABR514_04470 [Chthoniobacterales bacterium]
MKIKPSTRSAFFNPRIAFAFGLCFCGVLLGQANLGPINQTGTNVMTNQTTLGGGNVSVHK